MKITKRLLLLKKINYRNYIKYDFSSFISCLRIRKHSNGCIGDRRTSILRIGQAYYNKYHTNGLL